MPAFNLDRSGAAGLCTFLLLLLVCNGAAASSYSFLDQGAIRYFRGEDAALMSANLNAVLAAPEGAPARDWQNPETGSQGRAEVLMRFEHEGLSCRRVRITNHARGTDTVTTADMCDVDGSWKVLRLPPE
jgi:surface antigen